MRAPMTLDIISFCFSFHVLLYGGLCNQIRKRLEKDRKTEKYTKENVLRKDLVTNMIKRKKMKTPKILLMVTRIRARDE